MAGAQGDTRARIFVSDFRAELVAIVLSLPTTGPILISALQSQDMYLAGSFLMFLSMLTVVGVLISDIALTFLDPRIRLDQGTER